MNYYPFHLGDYAADTAHLEPMEDLAYRRMLDLYYRTERPLPDDSKEIARLIRLKDFLNEIETVLAEFFTVTNDGWRHGRCDAEISRMQDRQAKARASAQASVHARSTNAQRTLNERTTKVELPTPTPTPTPTPEEKTHTARERATLCVADLVADGVDEGHARDWLKARGKVPLTKTAWAAVKREAERGGIPVSQAVRVAAENGWRGFKSEWWDALPRQAPKSSVPSKPAWLAEREARMAEFTGKSKEIIDASARLVD